MKMVHIVAILITVTLGGCGGGDSAEAPPPPPKPTLAFVSKAPPDNTVVPVSAAIPFTYSYANADTFTHNFSMSCGGTPIATTTQVTPNTSAKIVVFAVTYTGAPLSAVCTVSATNILAKGLGGDSLPASISTTLNIVPI